ncbi:MAG: DUF1295 domain-containing protein, partial [Acidimicrobiia bacterium]|nr:DUF1295 domain-containing protein [Acidimicrobiia bacterium]
MAITPSSQHTLTGWLFVLAQAMLLIALIAVPRADDWPVPTWLNLTGVLLAGFGLLVMVAAALRLGPNLTPTPMPKAHGQLTTTGLYRYSRHPIYTGVLVLVVGIVVRS